MLICWLNLRLLNNMFSMLVTYYLCMDKSKRECISINLATLEARALATLRESGTSCNEYFMGTVNCGHPIGVRVF